MMRDANLAPGLIDGHCHLAPADFPANPAPDANSRWPCMVCGAGEHRTLTLGKTPFRQLDPRSWSADRRMEDMDRDGVAVQVLSPMPELLSYWFAPSEAVVLCDHVHAEIANMIAAHPTRFRGLGMAPLQDPAAAVRVLQDLESRFGLWGMEIGSNIDGVMLGDARFDPVWEAAQDLDLAIFVHALHPVATKTIGATPAFTAFAGFPLDVAMAAASLLMAGVPDRFPGLRIAFSHGGGGLGSILGRLDKGWTATSGYGGSAKRRPSEAAGSLFYDSNVYAPGYLQHLVQAVAPGQVFLGTDYPYEIMQTEPAHFLASAGISPLQSNDLHFNAARRFLGLGRSKLS